MDDNIRREVIEALINNDVDHAKELVLAYKPQLN